MKRFVYFFIMDLGISPFVKCYQDKSLVQACITTRRLHFLEEILSHHYYVISQKELEFFKKTAKGKDIYGNNIFHQIFMLPEGQRN